MNKLRTQFSILSALLLLPLAVFATTYTGSLSTTTPVQDSNGNSFFPVISAAAGDPTVAPPDVTFSWNINGSGASWNYVYSFSVTSNASPSFPSPPTPVALILQTVGTGGLFGTATLSHNGGAPVVLDSSNLFIYTSVPNPSGVTDPNAYNPAIAAILGENSVTTTDTFVLNFNSTLAPGLGNFLLVGNTQTYNLSATIYDSLNPPQIGGTFPSPFGGGATVAYNDIYAFVPIVANEVAAVPEPTLMLLLGSTLATSYLAKRKRTK